MVLRSIVQIADVTVLENTQIFSDQYSKIPTYRREKIDAFRFDRDKRLSLGAGILLKNAMEEYGIPSETPLHISEKGKPFFSEFPWFHFNLSHSGSKVMLGISSDEIGVDVEQIEKAKIDIAKRFFSPDEYTYIQNRETEIQKQTAFCRLWTLKESFVKATGQGLGLPFDTFSMDLSGNVPIVLQRNETNDYFFYEMADDGFCYACCLKGETEKPSFQKVELIKKPSV